jgi:uncharacterized protein YggE
MCNVVSLASFVLILAIAAPLAAHDVATLSEVIRVTGEGEATAARDMATVSTGVVTQADSAKTVLDQNNAAMQKLKTAGNAD